jgi:hypothetical protein
MKVNKSVFGSNAEKVFIRNFGINSVSIAENIATFMDASKALQLWSNQ